MTRLDNAHAAYMSGDKLKKISIEEHSQDGDCLILVTSQCPGLVRIYIGHRLIDKYKNNVMLP